ncbi:MAG: type II toxin-antitoxin system HigB family toxin [Bacteroidetes bacterium]|jgi:mRNA interferase HigB|nr:type II toxin-antitoxin system HigB family toxin [Bacteroidota bacterium]
MKIHLIKEKTIRNYIRENAGSRISFEEWLSKIKLADWNIPGDFKNTFPTSDLLGKGSSRVVFDIAGNSFRMICKYGFGEVELHLFVCWIGTHAEYDKLSKEEKQYTINVF